MKLRENFLFFIATLILHLGLVSLFALGFYILYFPSLIITLYLLHRYYSYFSLVAFFLYLVIAFAVINLEFYDEYIFELLLYIDAIDRNIYINSEVMYALITLHILLLINLKKFEKFWAIIDKKLFT